MTYGVSLTYADGPEVTPHGTLPEAVAFALERQDFAVKTYRFDGRIPYRDIIVQKVRNDS
jgi:hypothetical protein